MRENRGVSPALRIGSMLAIATAALGAGAAPAGASAAVTQCNPVQGYVVYANGVTCPTAKSIVRKLLALRYRAVKVTITSMPRYLCVATYARRTKKMRAGSCLRKGTQASGFGWTRNGAPVPLPPGVDPGTAGGTETTG
jgi:hypothetical protein